MNLKTTLGIEKETSFLILGILGVSFLILAIKDRNKTDKLERYETKRKGLSEILMTIGAGGAILIQWTFAEDRKERKRGRRGLSS